MNRNLVFAAIFATVTGVACAGDTNSKDFSALDTDKDGSITQEEALDMPNLSSDFRGLDADQNGRLTKAEFSKFEVDEDFAPDTSPDAGMDGGNLAPDDAEPGDAMNPATGNSGYGSAPDSP